MGTVSFILPDDMPNNLMSRLITAHFTGRPLQPKPATERTERSNLKKAPAERPHPWRSGRSGWPGDAAISLAQFMRDLPFESMSDSSMNIAVLRGVVLADERAAGIYVGYLTGISGGDPARFDIEFEDLRPKALKTDRGRAGYVFGLQTAAFGREEQLDPLFPEINASVLSGAVSRRAYIDICTQAFGLDCDYPGALSI